MMNILIADDHRLLREGLALLLNSTPGMAVVAQAENGKEAVTLALKHQPDVAIIDVTMPELNGVDAVRQIRREAPGVKLLALSMHLEEEHIRNMLDAGASGYLIKDCASTELVAALRAVRDGGIYLSPAAAALVVGEFLDNTTGRRRASKMHQVDNRLSMREREVLQLIAEGYSTHDTAAKLHISPKTIETHRVTIMKKLGLHGVAALTKYAIRTGLTPL